MQSAADARDWVRVAALVDERSPLLMNLSGEQTPDVLTISAADHGDRRVDHGACADGP